LQLEEFAKSKITMRSFSKEAAGIFRVFTYSKNPKEFFWTILLILARIYLWFKIFTDLKLKKESFKKTWTRVETTK